MKKKLPKIIFVALFLLSVISYPMAVSAASYSPAPLYHSRGSDETVMKTGKAVHLFHSGTDDVKAGIREGDIIPVYRISPSCEVHEVGKVKVIAYVGQTYIKAEVIEGEIKPNDVAQKGGVSLLVISAGMCGQ